jgi:hypothetical protein
LRKTLKQRLLDNVQIDEQTGCWNWLKYKDKNQYGHMKVLGKSELVHRMAYQTLVGDIPIGMFVCHKCDNPSCLNPDHLFLGTNQDNINDKVAKNRQSKNGQQKGSKHSLAKLTEKDVVDIRASTLSQNKLALLYGVTQSSISHIQNKITWSHV